MTKFKICILTFIITLFPAFAMGNIEINYLIFLRPDLKNLSNKEIIKIAKNSLIREIIKKKRVTKSI